MPKVSKESATVAATTARCSTASRSSRATRSASCRSARTSTRRRCYKGLPDDRCQCPHWGYVISGAVTFRYADREEVFEAGDAFYMPPGHVPVKHEPGTEFVQFSPTEELRRTEAVMERNMKAMQSA